jgi:hypothetical protein
LIKATIAEQVRTPRSRGGPVTTFDSAGAITRIGEARAQELLLAAFAFRIDKESLRPLGALPL